MANLCSVAGLHMQKLSELSQKSRRDRTSYEESYNGAISGNINKIWTQERYDIIFTIEKDTLSVSIRDKTYEKQIPPSERSDGFQWFLSFYTTLRAQTSGLTANTIILLDNPALELHLDGQKDIKRFLENDVASVKTQVIYVTHSPGMLDPIKVKQVRFVELLSDNRGTRIHEINSTSNALESIRSFIGSSICYSLLCKDYIVKLNDEEKKALITLINQTFSKDDMPKSLEEPLKTIKSKFNSKLS